MEQTERHEDDLGELGEKLAPRIEEAKQHLRDINERVIAFVKERPGTCLVAALAAGFLVGRMLRR